MQQALQKSLDFYRTRVPVARALCNFFIEHHRYSFETTSAAAQTCQLHLLYQHAP